MRPPLSSALHWAWPAGRSLPRSSERASISGHLPDGRGTYPAGRKWPARLDSPPDTQDESKSDQPEGAVVGGLTELNRGSRVGGQGTAKWPAQGRDQDHGRHDDAHDDLLFEALERLERRMATGMARRGNQSSHWNIRLRRVLPDHAGLRPEW